MTRFLHGLGHALFAGFMATAWSALALADLGRFSAWPCVVLGLLVALAVYYFARREMDNGHPPSQAETLASGAAAIIAAGTLFLSLPPSEMVLGGWDPGVYMHTAAAVSRGGSLRIDDPDLASLGPRERQVVARDLFGVVEPFGGMRVLPNGKTSPEFHHLYPSFLAVAYSAGGIRAAQAVNPLLCAVAVILIFLLAKRMLGSGAALMAALLLAMNPAQVWQAGFSTAEPLTQVLLLGGLLYLGPALEGRSMLDAILCGAAFGLALLARYDTVLLLVPLTLVVIVAWQRPLSTSHAQVAAGVFALVLLHLFLHQRYVAPYYTPLRDTVGRMLMVSGAAVVLWALLCFQPVRLPDRLRPHALKIRRVAVLGFLAWVAFAWFVRPGLDEPGLIPRALAALLPSSAMGELAGDDAYNMLMLLSLVGKCALALAFSGIAVMLYRADKTWELAWLYASVAVMVLLVSRVFNDHFMMWVARRFVPVVVPLLAIATAAGLQALGRKIAERSGLAAMAMVLVLGATAVSATIRPLGIVSSTRDWPGLIEWFERVAPTVPDDALVYCDQPGFAAPLRYLHGKHSFELQLKSDDRRERLADLMAVKLDQGASVCFLSMQGPLRHPGFTGTPIGVFPLNTHTLETREFEVPEGTKARGGEFVLYRLASTSGR